jgi:hypothetical protein
MSPRVAALLLWCALGIGVLLIVAMTWHPWVAGSRAGCAPNEARAWDGRCYPGKAPF